MIMDFLIQFCNISTVGLCFICKIPQILAIAKTRSVAGVSLTSVMVEFLGYSIVLGYNLVKEYPLEAFFEYVLLVIQDMILLLLIFFCLGTLNVIKVGLLGGFITLFYGFTIGIPHPGVLPGLIAFVTPISASSKIIQLKEIWTTKNSDNVSELTWIIAAYTCITRIFTTLIQTGDVPLLINYTIAFILNLFIIVSARKFRTPVEAKKK